VAPQPLKATFPAHRLFYNGKFNLIHSQSDRALEIIRFHINRCRDILRIADGKPTGLDDIAAQHFAPELLKGGGIDLARVELIAHIEIMQACGHNTGSKNYLSVMESYMHR
jgi:hypothetical protein